MSYSRTNYFEKRVLNAGELSEALTLLLADFAAQPARVRCSVHEVLPDGTGSSQDDLPVSKLDFVCDLTRYAVSTGFTEKAGGDIASMRVHGTGNVYQVEGTFSTAVDLAAAIARLASLLKLAERASPLDEMKQKIEAGELQLKMLSESVSRATAEGVILTFPEISDRIKALEAAVFAPKRVLRCFLSYRFQPENELTALRVQQFLHLLDVIVLSGAGYEPRRITEKVLARLREPLDFVVVIISSDGQSMWTRDEIAWAITVGVPIIPLVEHGAKFEPGLFGDIEYIAYDTAHISDTFLNLLQAIRFIRDKKT